MNEQQFGFGAQESKKDYRTIPHDYVTAIPLTSGGYQYDPTEIENQHKVGICTAISLVQNAEKALGKKYSFDFQYLLQKKFIDGDWYEGSSIFSALKVGKNYGFLPIEDFVYISEADRSLPYADYIAKLQAIPDTEIQRLITLCGDKLTGYAQIPQISSQSLAQAILDSKSGILCRYSVGQEWWTAQDGRISWLPADINPLRPPKQVISGHAIGMPYFDYTKNLDQTLCNTWGPEWDKQGLADVIFDQYQPTEAWIPYYDFTPNIPNLPVHQPLTQNLFLGIKSDDVKRLQHVLGVTPESGWFGPLTLLAVIKYQKNNNISPAIGFVGPITRASLNSKFF